jgi:hypothetical protein
MDFLEPLCSYLGDFYSGKLQQPYIERVRVVLERVLY